MYEIFKFLVVTFAFLKFCKFLLKKSEEKSLKFHFNHPQACVLLVIAHPDDECMFFAPTIRSLVNFGVRIDILCLSTGNYEGIGKKRSLELLESCQVLGITGSVSIRDNLKDGPVAWDICTVSNEVQSHILTMNPSPTHILTFDIHGVSKHLNHISVCKGIRRLLREKKQAPILTGDEKHASIKAARKTHECYLGDQINSPIKLLELESSPFKWTGILSIIVETVRNAIPSSSNNQIVTSLFLKSYIEHGISAMRKHQSQMLWFRYLYLGASSHMHVNRIMVFDRSTIPP